MHRFLRPLQALVSLIFIVAMSPVHGADMPANAHYKVVFAVTENDQKVWNEVFGNFRNVQRELGPQNVAIELVVYADGIAMLRDDSLVFNKVEEARNDGVKIVACMNTMNAQNITKDTMLPDIDYVQAGIVELIKLQAEGWAYVRP